MTVFFVIKTIDTLQGVHTTMKSVNKTMKTVLLAVILLATLTVASVLPNEPVTVGQHQQWPRQKGKSSGSSSVDLYKNMVMFEQEQGNSDDDDDNDNDDGKDNGGSLLSMMTDDVKDDAAALDDQPMTLLKCVSCSGILPLWRNQRNSHVDEQSFCLPDVGGSTVQQEKSTTGHENYQSICIGAVRCWKAIVREREGFIRVSRGCVGGGGSGGDRHLSKAAAAQQLRLHPCMGAVPVVKDNGNETTSKGNENPQQLPYTVWTSSYSYSSADSSQQKPPSYAIECCAGHDLCNDGLFPFLPGDSLITEDNSSLLISAFSWQWSSFSAIALIFVLVIFGISVIKFFKHGDKKKHRKRRRHRSKSSSRQKSKRRKRSNLGHCKDESVHSDDSDKKPHRRFSFTSDSSFSSLSSIGSSSSCCEGKPRRTRSRRKSHVTALNMLDLLKDVVVTNDVTDEGDSHRPSYAIAYSPAAVTESTLGDDFLPPPYQQNDHQENDLTSGSGYGMPVLVQRTLAKQIQLRQLVGKGRYGEVWRATYWNGGHEHVAVKIFLSKDEPSWKRETEIYSTVLMRHDNILGFIGSDIMTSRNSYTTQLLLITHYHQHGSLYDFLQTPLAIDTICNGYNIGTSNTTTADRPPLTMTQMLNILYTVAAGLCHLHTEIHGTQGKPGIAHRDIKSKNVLVKCAQTGACCVADFGMAVTSRDATLPAQTTTAAGAGNQNTRVGTKRYMAPEVLDDSISSAAMLSLASASTGITAGSAAATSPSAYWCFDAYRRGDVYSYALVVWEVLSRTFISPKVDNDDLPKYQQCIVDNEYNPYVYRAPYQDRGAGWDPGFDDMRHIVCSSDPVLSRPGVAAEWLANPIVNAVVVTMRECWHNNPNARLPMLRVKKTLAKLKDQYAQIEQNEKLTETTTD